jgi:hypothetical protein
VLECVKLPPDRAHVIDPPVLIGVLLIVRRPTVIKSRRALARFDAPKHGINHLAFIVPIGHLAILTEKRLEDIPAKKIENSRL